MEKIDKSTWGAGPWQSEPDSEIWRDGATGLPCAILRNPELGHLCGYVGVPPGHAFFGWSHNDPIAEKSQDGDAIMGKDVGYVDAFLHAFAGNSHGTIPLGMTLRVHGGITCSGSIVLPGCDFDPSPFHWFGFDCGHTGDLSPGFVALVTQAPRPPDMPLPDALWCGAVYRTFDYVRKETAFLAVQLKQRENEHERLSSDPGRGFAFPKKPGADQ